MPKKVDWWLWTPLLLVAGSACLFVGLLADQPVLLAFGFLALLAKLLAATVAVPVLLSEELAYQKQRARSQRPSAP